MMNDPDFREAVERLKAVMAKYGAPLKAIGTDNEGLTLISASVSSSEQLIKKINPESGLPEMAGIQFAGVPIIKYD